MDMTEHIAQKSTSPDQALGMELVLDELLDLTLYQELRRHCADGTRPMLDSLIPVETRHLAFWKNFFKIGEADLDWLRRIKLRILIWICRLFGPSAIHLTLEAIEVYGIRKYLSVWQRYKNDPLGRAVKDILQDEFEHEDTIVSGIASRRLIRPEDVRSIFLGLNDGLVEILGAVSGFFAAFSSRPSLVLMAGSSVAVAGAISMAAGAYMASGSELEVLRLEHGKAEFLGKKSGTEKQISPPLRTAFLVGFSYLLGALIPILPVIFGGRTLVVPLVAAGSVLILVSIGLGFLSGMEIHRRVATNLLLMSIAVAITYAIGIFARSLWGISI